LDGLERESHKGLKVVSHRSMKMATWLAIGDMELEMAYDESSDLHTPEAGALFLSSVNRLTVNVMAHMEA